MSSVLASALGPNWLCQNGSIAGKPALGSNRVREYHLDWKQGTGPDELALGKAAEGNGVCMTQWIYKFGGGSADGRADMKNLLGGKGANLAEMASLGLPVPPGFTISTDVCTHYYDNDLTYPDSLSGDVDAAVAHIERAMDAGFGDAGNPLLVSVRSGARVSMPGMMDTVLNLGLNDQTVAGLAARSGDERFCLG